MIDQNRVKQVVINLVSNAIKFSATNDIITLNITNEVDCNHQKTLVNITVID